jgi:negative regulator of flagellin synthesis FlgM
MNNIDTRAPFFPNSTKANTKGKIDNAGNISLKRNDPQKAQEIADKAAVHTNVTINDSIKDFAKIKKIADSPVEVDNSEKIARLKAQINAGTYNIDYDAVADKILENEF